MNVKEWRISAQRLRFECGFHCAQCGYSSLAERPVCPACAEKKREAREAESSVAPVLVTALRSDSAAK